jgi:hypothetical protein
MNGCKAWSGLFEIRTSFKIVGLFNGHDEGGGVAELVECPPKVMKVKGSNHGAD